MQERHQNRNLYFKELAKSSRKYFLPYVLLYKPITKQTKILEIGCGDGGNLLPFAELGCSAVGVDLSEGKIENARAIYARKKIDIQLIADDIFKIKEFEQTFDVILVHDVIEHIHDKRQFVNNLRRYIAPDGIVFFRFPAWQMPFGGHQQICRSKLLSNLPYCHLLPKSLYRKLLKAFHEDEGTIHELLDIQCTQTPIELFEKVMKEGNFEILNRRYYFINPHYETKFGLKPRLLFKPLAKIPYLRNFFTTSCFYIVRPRS
ncbi:bifunctional 2-polyprenyl-6-hydroxyphenol methylase/3-demethylubiquinol 3-O-methyltransferase UbiG [Parabacteroides sp. Marseille-P3160]|uniref:class I SAM-dependent methyltransferase n=1 Tax=Parabacteroides sp. Marseille-P3160 TaxID=1917887 RepID=UPI0009B99408|nr:class I SAM-dependent methyltransferase [Parabacteroides sp. Marseille-P3160]